MEQYLWKSRIDRVPGRLLEERCDEEGKIAASIVAKIDKIRVNTFGTGIWSNGNSIGAIQKDISRTLEEELVRWEDQWIELREQELNYKLLGNNRERGKHKT